MAQMVKNLPATQKTQETRVRSLVWGDPLKKGMALHSGILAWRIPWTEEPGRLQSTGPQRVGHDGATNTPPNTKERTLGRERRLGGKRGRGKCALQTPEDDT